MPAYVPLGGPSPISLLRWRAGRLALRCLDARRIHATCEVDSLSMLRWAESAGGIPASFVERPFELVLASALAPPAPKRVDPLQHVGDVTPHRVRLEANPVKPRTTQTPLEGVFCRPTAG
jgi:hypothetical protein